MTAYPLTIAQARYGGAYEGSEWIAFHLEPCEVPEEAFGDNSQCAEWWLDNGEGVGRGKTPHEALENLTGIAEPLQMVRSGGFEPPQLGRAPWRR